MRLPVKIFKLVPICLSAGLFMSASCFNAVFAEVESANQTDSSLSIDTEPELRPAKDMPEAVKSDPKADAKSKKHSDSGFGKEPDSNLVKPGFLSWKVDTLGRVRSDGRLAKRLAKYHWLDKMVMANPELSEAIANHRRAAMILAQHVRITEIAEADPYLCRRITKWKGAARKLAANPNARYVISRDPEGMYRAIRRDKKISQILSKNPIFDQMIVDNPELGRVISHYM